MVEEGSNLMEIVERRLAPRKQSAGPVGARAAKEFVEP